MRGILVFCVWLLFVSAASASPCIDLDPSGQSYPCGQGTFQLNSTAVHVDDLVVLTADLSAVEPVTNFGFLFIGSFNITSSSNSGLQYVFNGYFSGAGESRYLGLFYRRVRELRLRGGDNGPGCSVCCQVVNVLNQVAIASVPELSTWAMLLIGFAAIGGLARRRFSRVQLATG